MKLHLYNSRIRIVLLLIGVGLLWVGNMACGGSQDLKKDTKSLIFHGEDWDFIPLFENHNTYKVGARYARAVGQFGGCSSFLIDDEYVTTARHCRPETLTRRRMTFGRYGVASGNYERGIQDARNRLQDIGFPVGFVSNLSRADLQSWDCHMVSSEYTSSQKRDIDHWKCSSHIFIMTLPVKIKFSDNPTIQERTRNYGVHIYPGHIYGHYNVRPGHRYEGYKLYGASFNYKSSQSPVHRSVLLSPSGFITDRNNAYILGGKYHKNGFEYIGTDMVAGSSGGPIIGRNDHRVIGVHSKGSHSHGSRKSYTTSYISRQINYNIGAYMSSRVLQYNATEPKKYYLSLTATSRTRWIGGTGGTLHDMKCPEGFLAAGIVHSNSSRRYVGNFGLICVPFWNSLLENQLDRAVVIAGGSHDTKRGSIQKDFNTFTKENLTIDGKDHPFAMCPPGYQLSGIEMRKDTQHDLFRGVKRVECARFEGVYAGHGSKMALYHRPPRQRTHWSYLGTKQRAACPVGQVVMGIRIRSGDLTDGFSFHCKRIFRPRVPNP